MHYHTVWTVSQGQFQRITGIYAKQAQQSVFLPIWSPLKHKPKHYITFIYFLQEVFRISWSVAVGLRSRCIQLSSPGRFDRYGGIQGFLCVSRRGWCKWRVYTTLEKYFPVINLVTKLHQSSTYAGDALNSPIRGKRLYIVYIGSGVLQQQFWNFNLALNLQFRK